jgi:hypothetical protein
MINDFSERTKQVHTQYAGTEQSTQSGLSGH